MEIVQISPAGLKRKPFFYDRQIARYMVQLLSCFSGYQIVTGNQRNGQRQFIDVPCMLGDYQYAAAVVFAGGTENVMPSLPMISLYMTGLKQKAEWRLNPQHFEYYRYIRRARDGDGNLLVNQPGERVTVERHMPVPYDMDFEVSIWASNNDQGYQLLEQILTVFNPDIDVQLSNSPADWIFLTRILFSGDVRLEKAIPSGEAVADPIYTYTLPFQVTVFMSPPAKVYTDKPIYEIQVPIKDLESSIDFDNMTVLDGIVIKASPQDIADSESLK